MTADEKRVYVNMAKVERRKRNRMEQAKRHQQELCRKVIERNERAGQKRRRGEPE